MTENAANLDFTTSLGNLLLCFITLQSNTFPDVHMEPSVFLFMLIAFFLSLDTTERACPDLPSLNTLLQTSVHVGQCQVSLPHPIGKKLHSLNCLSGLLLDSVWQLRVSLTLGSPDLDAGLQVVHHQS